MLSDVCQRFLSNPEHFRLNLRSQAPGSLGQFEVHGEAGCFADMPSVLCQRGRQADAWSKLATEIEYREPEFGDNPAQLLPESLKLPPLFFARLRGHVVNQIPEGRHLLRNTVVDLTCKSLPFLGRRNATQLVEQHRGVEPYRLSRRAVVQIGQVRRCPTLRPALQC